MKKERLRKTSSKNIGEIKETFDYSKFSFLDSNRKINSRNLAKLVASMKEKQLKIPILVNKDFKIIDGQHRFLAAKELELPIYYYIIEDYGIEEMKRANLVNSSWTKKDFLNMFVEEGDTNYEIFNRIIEDFDISILLLIKVFSSMQGKSQKDFAKLFEEGILDISEIEKVEDFLLCLEDFSFFKPYKTLQFVTAFLKLYMQPKYDHEVMRQRLEKRRDSLKKKSTTDDYLVLLTKEIYSFGAVKTPIYYDKDIKEFYVISK